jgi:hypothetical protein
MTTVQQIADEVAALFKATGDFDVVAAVMEKYEAQGVDRDSTIAAMNLVSKLLHDDAAQTGDR